RRARGRATPRLNFRPEVLWLEARCLLTTVTNLDDAGPGSLRQAIADTPATGTVDFQEGLKGTITLTSAPLIIAKLLTITGPGASMITVSGDNARQVFIISTASTVAISGLTIAKGKDPQGGGIYNAGTLTITGCTLSGNSVGSNTGVGGAIDNSG